MENVTLHIKKVFDVSPDDLFEAWTDPEQVALWYGPEGFAKSDIHIFDLKEGGSYALTMNAPDGAKHKLRGTFKEIDKPKKFVFTWQWENDNDEEMGAMGGAETLVTVEFKPLGDKTEMVFTHIGFVSEEVKNNHNKGWMSSFNKLEKVVSS